MLICVRAKECNVTECYHAKEHEETPSCYWPCFEGGVCIEVVVKPEIYKALYQDFERWARDNGWFEYYQRPSSPLMGGKFYEYYTPAGQVVCIHVNKDGRIET